MTIEQTDNQSLENLCPHFVKTIQCSKIPDDITACLRVATQDEVAQHKNLSDSKGLFTKSKELASDYAVRAANTAAVVWNKMDFRGNLERSVYTSPYVSIHKIFPHTLYISRHPVVVDAMFKPNRNDDSEDSCYHLTSENTKTLELFCDLLNENELSFNDSISVAPKDQNKKYHKFLNHFFNSKNVSKLVNSIGAIANETTEKWFSECESNVDMSINLTSATKVFATTVMSKQFLGQDGYYEDLCPSIDRIILLIVSKFLKQSLDKETLSHIENDKKVLRSHIKAAMENKSEYEEDASLVEQMLNSGDFTEKQVKIMAFTLFLAGQETTASSLNYVLLKCAQNPELQKNIRLELEDIIQQNECTLAEASTKSKLIKQVIVEGLRMFTPAYSLGRILKEDCILEIEKDGTIIESHYLEKGNRVNPCPAFAARHPSIVPDDSDTFDHTRIDPDDIPNFLPKLPWRPFGRSPHSCPGWGLAYHEEMILIGTVLANYRIQTETKGEPKIIGKFTSLLEDDVYITMTQDIPK